MPADSYRSWTRRKSTIFNCHYLPNRSTLDRGVLGFFSVQFNIRNTLPKSGPFLLLHPVYSSVPNYYEVNVNVWNYGALTLPWSYLFGLWPAPYFPPICKELTKQYIWAYYFKGFLKRVNLNKFPHYGISGIFFLIFYIAIYNLLS